MANSFDSTLEFCFSRLYSKTNKSLYNKTPAFMKYTELLPEGFLCTYPNSAILKVTSECNMRCKHCFYNGLPECYNGSDDLPAERLLSLISELAELGVLSVTLTGGEPFFRNDIFKIIEKIKSFGLILSIQTNGILIDEKIADFLDKILYKKTDFLMISIDGAESVSYDEIRGKGNFDKLIRSLEILQSRNIPVALNFTFTSKSADRNIIKIFDICEQYNIKYLKFNKFKVCNDEQKELEPVIEDCFKYTKLLIETADKHKNFVTQVNILKIYDFLKFEHGRKLLDNHIGNEKPDNSLILTCHGHNRATIAANGNVFLCSMDDSEDAVIGNVKNNNFIDVWENRIHNCYFQPRLLENSTCKKCKYVIVCRTGCVASAYKKYKNINMPAADCEYFEDFIGVCSEQ